MTPIEAFKQRLACADTERLTVVAFSELAQINQVFLMDGRRLVVRCRISAEQYQEARKRNREVRLRHGIEDKDCRWLAVGDAPKLDVVGNPPEPPPECTFFYWVEDLPFQGCF